MFVRDIHNFFQTCISARNRHNFSQTNMFIGFEKINENEIKLVKPIKHFLFNFEFIFPTIPHMNENLALYKK